jgi:hypothetical protein
VQTISEILEDFEVLQEFEQSILNILHSPVRDRIIKLIKHGNYFKHYIGINFVIKQAHMSHFYA